MIRSGLYDICRILCPLYIPVESDMRVLIRHFRI